MERGKKGLQMHIHLPNSAFLGNCENFLRKYTAEKTNILHVTMHDKWVSVHPVFISLIAALSTHIHEQQGEVTVDIQQIRSLPYLIRMRLFDYLHVNPGIQITEHESSGRFIPLTQIKSNQDLQKFITDVIPLLHSAPEYVTPIKYVISELVRNVLEHSKSKNGAFVCAQYFKNTKRVGIGIADCGIGIRNAISASYKVNSDEQALTLALTPGITGTTRKLGGTEANAGAGLFFVKGIAKISRNFFMLYSGSSTFKLRKTPRKEDVVLHTDPLQDFKRFWREVPHFPGTAVGVDVAAENHAEFEKLLNTIYKVYRLDVRNKNKAKYKKAKFI
ncbi:MAG: hypothetical protein JW925_14415 [Syntrophaceae bacterium]|nr:hypothetical protein [Syntrophaceae bacterium]